MGVTLAMLQCILLPQCSYSGTYGTYVPSGYQGTVQGGIEQGVMILVPIVIRVTEGQFQLSQHSRLAGSSGAKTKRSSDEVSTDNKE